jgi:hypothetical protein
MKRNLILLVVCALIAMFYFWDQKRQEEKETAEEKEKVLIELKKDEIAEITLLRHENTMKAVKEGEKWKLVEPLQALGDTSAWNAIASTLSGGKRERVISENAEELGLFGLDNSTLQVTVAGIEGATASTVIFGKESPVSGKYYAMIQGTNDVVTVPQSWHTTVAKSLHDLRDKTIMELESSQVHKIEIANATGAFTLERTGETDWIVSKPFVSRASDADINDMISTIKNGTIVQFIEEKPDFLDIYGLSEPSLRLTFWQGEDAQGSLAAQTLLIGSTNEMEYFYGKLESKDNVFVIKPDDLDKVPETAEALRTKKITSIRSWEVKEIRVLEASEVILEATKQDTWTLLQPQQGEAEYNTMSDAVRSITELEAEAFVDSATDVDFSQPAITIELTSDKQAISLPILQQEDAYYIQRQNPVEVLKLQAGDVQKILDDAKAVRLEDPPLPEEVGEDEEAEEAETN